MSTLARHIRTAVSQRYAGLSMESAMADFEGRAVTLEHLMEDIASMESLCSGLVASMSLMDNAPAETHGVIREQVVSMLSVAGMDDISELVPSLESTEPGAWDRFKAFVLRLWNTIVEMYDRVSKFISDLLRRSTIAEKVAIAKVKDLRKKVATRARHGITVKAELPARVNQAPLFDRTNQFSGAAEAVSVIGQYQKTRDALQRRYVGVLLDALADVELKTNLKNVPKEEQVAAVQAAHAAAAKAVLKVDPAIVRKILNTNPKGRLPLYYDRELAVMGPDLSAFKGAAPADVMDMISQIGVQVIQVPVPELNTSAMPVIRALRPEELARLLNACETLLDVNHSSEVMKDWEKIEDRLSSLKKTSERTAEYVATLDQNTLIPGFRETLTDLIRFSTFGLRWAAAPYQQMTSLNTRLVNAVLSLVEQHVSNYTTSDDEDAKVADSKPSA